MKPRVGFLKRSTTLKKFQPDSSKKKEDSNNIRNEGEEIAADATKIQSITRTYYEKLYAHILEDLVKWINSRNLPSSKTESGRNRRFELSSYQ